MKHHAVSQLSNRLDREDPQRFLVTLAETLPARLALQAVGRAVVAAARLAWQVGSLGDEDCPLETLRGAERDLLEASREPQDADVHADLVAKMPTVLCRRACETLSMEAHARGDAKVAATAAAAWYAAKTVSALADLLLEGEGDDWQMGQEFLASLNPATQVIAATASMTSPAKVRDAVRGEVFPWLEDARDLLAARVAAEKGAGIRSPRARDLARRTLKPEAISALGFGE